MRKHSFICLVFFATCILAVFRIAFERNPQLLDHTPVKQFAQSWTRTYGAAHPDVRNNGSVSLAWNEKWAHNFVNKDDVNSVSDSQSLVMDIHANQEDSRAHGRYWIDRILTEEEREQSLRGISKLLKELPVNWPNSQYEPGRADTIVTLERLRDCIESDSCRPGETTVIMGASPHYGNSQHEKNSGEDIWQVTGLARPQGWLARSSIDAFKELGHTVVYSYELLEMLDIYLAIGHLVPVIIAQADTVANCATLGIPQLLKDRDFTDWYGAITLSHEELVERWNKLGITVPEMYSSNEDSKQQWGWRKPKMWEADHPQQFCVKTKIFPTGIPIWKLTSMKFWPGPDHPLGRAWTLSPEDYGSHPGNQNSGSHNFFLGYSTAKYVKAFNYTGLGEKRHAGFVFAKNTNYFEKQNFAFWHENRTFADLKAVTALEFISVAGSKDDVLPDPGLENYGRQPMPEFYRLMSQARFMMGIGAPTISPTPYDGLALGLPFINPIMDWDRNDPMNKQRWNCQHNGLFNELPPYVYHVFKGDLDGLEEVVKAAVANPIDSYTPAHVTAEANRARHQDLVNLNWYSLAERRLRHLREGGHETLFIL